MKLTRFVFIFLVLILTILLLAGAVKGNKGTPLYYQEKKDTRVGGPFEASNTTARYALTEAIVKHKSFFLSEDLAKFASPDVADYKGRFISLFTPGVSFIAVPFFILGDFLGYPQLITFMTVPVFAIINLLLVARLAYKLGANFYVSILAGFISLFATNALVYSQTLTQHHMSTSLILLAILNAINKRTFINNLILGVISGASLLIDIANLFLMLPIIFYVFIKHFEYQKIGDGINLKFKMIIIGILIGAAPLLAVFGWYNYATTGSFTLITQNIGRSKLFKDQLPEHLINETVVPVDKTVKWQVPDLPFNTRKQLNGVYILLFSNERSWLFYSPVVLLGILGFYYLYQEKEKKTKAIITGSVVLINFVLYSMFGDVWGGWSFGSRYLIPSAAIICAPLAIVINKYYRNLIFASIFVILVTYSVFISATGAMTTSAVPPKVEAVNLSQPIPYTYEYNFQLVNRNESSSLVYNLFLKESVSLITYTFIYSFLVLMIILMLYMKNLLNNESNTEKKVLNV